jgi:TonB family protein
MSIGQTLVGILVFATSSVILAQTTETKPPELGSTRASDPSSTAAAANARRGMGKGQGQAEILTDTLGVDFAPYLARIREIVRSNWINLMPPQVYPPISKQGKVSIEFFIMKDGKVGTMKIHATSGDVALDRAAWASITASNPFPPLPTEFSGQRLGLRFHYFYNRQAPDISIRISPSADSQVAAGSTLQFSAFGEGITDTSVTWGVSGPGCSAAACGTISDTGLYTAPVNIPNPPTVVVEATFRTDTSVRSTSKLTIVEANPSH